MPRQQVGKVTYYWSYQTTLAPVDFTIDWSDDATTWTTALTQTGVVWSAVTPPPIGLWADFIVPAAGRHRYWRINCTQAGGTVVPLGATFGIPEIVFSPGVNNPDWPDYPDITLFANVGGTALASVNNATAALGADGNAASVWNSGTAVLPQWWGWDFGEDPSPLLALDDLIVTMGDPPPIKSELRFDDMGQYGSLNGGDNGPHTLQSNPAQDMGTFQFAVVSLWFKDILSAMNQGGFAANFSNGTTLATNFIILGNPDNIIVICGDGTDYANTLGGMHGNGYSYIGFQVFPYTLTAAITHVLVSIDSVNNIIQVYVNDIKLTADPANSEWTTAAPMSSTADGVFTVAGYNDDGGLHGCVGEIYATVNGGDPSNVFFDLDITANRRQFIDADGSHIDLYVALTNPNGSTLPFSTPNIFLTLSNAINPTDLLTDRWLTDSWSTPGSTTPLQFCAGSEPPPITEQSTQIFVVT